MLAYYGDMSLPGEVWGKTLSLTVWAQTKSYFKSGTGKVVTQWPFSASRYILSTKVTPYTSVDYGGIET